MAALLADEVGLIESDLFADGFEWALLKSYFAIVHSKISAAAMQ